MSDHLTDLRDYSRQELRVGKPPHYLFGENERPQDKELMRLSIGLRIAEALEAQTGILKQQMELLYGQRAAFRQEGGTGNA